MDKIAIEFDIGIGRRIKMVLAIIDLGSNSIRMDIVEIDEKTGSHRYIERCRDMARLSEGMNLDGNLQPEAIDRTIAALSEFIKKRNERIAKKKQEKRHLLKYAKQNLKKRRKNDERK